MTFDWYRARVAAKGIVAAYEHAGHAHATSGRHAARDRAVPCSSIGCSEAIAQFPSYPHGILIRVLPPGAPVPSVAEVIALNKQLYAAFVLDDPRPGPDDDYATEVHRRYAGIWDILSRGAERAGNRELADEARTIAQEARPRMKRDAGLCCSASRCCSRSHCMRRRSVAASSTTTTRGSSHDNWIVKSTTSAKSFTDTSVDTRAVLGPSICRCAICR